MCVCVRIEHDGGNISLLFAIWASCKSPVANCIMMELISARTRKVLVSSQVDVGAPRALVVDAAASAVQKRFIVTICRSKLELAS